MTKKDISVLIIEDEVVLALGLECTLKSFGYRVLCGIQTSMQSTMNHLNIIRQILPWWILSSKAILMALI